MKSKKRRSHQCTRNKLCSPGRPPGWQRENLCRFWKAIASGRTSEDAGVDAGFSAPVGVRWFRRAGGMPPTHLAASAKSLSGRFLTFEEREDIALELAKGSGIRSIARKLGRAPSSISREVRRNAATRGGNLDYKASTAQWHADRAAQRPKPGKLTINTPLRHYVQDRLAGKVTTPEGVGFIGPAVVWKGRRASTVKADDGRKPGALSKLLTACGSTFPEIRICASVMKQSTRLCTSRDAVRCAEI